MVAGVEPAVLRPGGGQARRIDADETFADRRVRRHRSVNALGDEDLKTRRIEIAVLRDVHRSCDVHLDAGLAGGGRLPVEHLRGETQRARFDRRTGFLLEGMRIAAKDEDAARPEIKVVSLAGERLVAGATRERETDEERRRAARALEGGGAPELESPSGELERQARLHIERRRRVPHPLERELDGARRRQRDEMARHDHPGVAVGAAVAALAVALQDDDAVAAARTFERGGKADDAPAHDHHAALAQRMPQQNGSRSSSTSVLSAVMNAVPEMRGATIPVARSSHL